MNFRRLGRNIKNKGLLKGAYSSFIQEEEDDARNTLKNVYGKSNVFDEPKDPYSSGVYDPTPKWNSFMHAFSAAKRSSLGQPKWAVDSQGWAKEKGSSSYNQIKTPYDKKKNVLDTNRDYWNNDEGFTIGKKNLGASKEHIAKEVIKAMDSGQLITDLRDPLKRQSKHMNKNINVYDEADKYESKIPTIEEIGKMSNREFKEREKEIDELQKAGQLKYEDLNKQNKLEKSKHWFKW